MFVLAIDTATPAVTAGVVEVSTRATAPVVELSTVVEHVTVDARAHVEALLPNIGRCLAQAGLTGSDLTAVVTGTGPGPFTGLRVGMATAQAFADASDLPLYGVCSLDAIAYAASWQASERPTGGLLVATDARRKEVYWAQYSAAGVRRTPPAVDTPARLRELLDSEENSPTWAVGEGAVAYADTLGLPVSQPVFPSSAGLVHGALERLTSGATTEQPRPLYLRRPDATPSVNLASA